MGDRIQPEITLASDEPRRSSGGHSRHGAPGRCQACQQPVVTHFDSAGQWAGCTKASATTVFELTPIPTKQVVVVAPVDHDDAESAPVFSPMKKRVGRRRMEWVAPKNKSIKALGITGDHRTKVAKALLAGDERTRDIMERYGLTNNQIQPVIKWLEAHGHVRVRDDSKSK
jgi:hypothetical protein